MAFKVGGWHDDLLVATCVLQVLCTTEIVSAYCSGCFVLQKPKA